MKTILLIDDDTSFREVAMAVLLAADYDVLQAACPDDAFKLLERERVDLILCDLHMPFAFGERYSQFEHSHRVGIKTIQELSGVFPQIPVIGLTATPRVDLERIARTLGEIPTFEKPGSGVELLGIVERCFEMPGVAYRQ
jgi:CheY-like chemotaxis protein